MNRKLTHVPLAVSDQGRAFEYYTTKVGFEKRADYFHVGKLGFEKRQDYAGSFQDTDGARFSLTQPASGSAMPATISEDASRWLMR